MYLIAKRAKEVIGIICFQHRQLRLASTDPQAGSPRHTCTAILLNLESGRLNLITAFAAASSLVSKAASAALTSHSELRPILPAAVPAIPRRK